MTVSYSLDYATSGFFVFIKLLFRWKGSIYKLIWAEVLIYFGLYFVISLVYRFALNTDQKTFFENLALFCDHYSSYIPVSWILGFYVNMVVSRTMFYLATYAPGNDEATRIFRRTVARLMSLGNIIVLRDVSTAVRKRFPTMDHVANAGFMTDEEFVKYETMNCPHPKYWVVMQWAVNMVTEAHQQGKIKSERYVIKLHEEIMKYRGAMGNLLSFDWISIPLAYTQVVTLAVKSYFLICLIGRQMIDPEKLQQISSVPYWHMDIYFPFFTFLQFIFYVGWLKVAESLINPLGEDDDDFELNYLIDRNLQMSYLIVDKNNYEKPTVERDVHWNEDLAEIAHTEASAGLKDRPEIGSAVPVTYIRFQFLRRLYCIVLRTTYSVAASFLNLAMYSLIVKGQAAEQFLPSERGSVSVYSSRQSGLNRRRNMGQKFIRTLSKKGTADRKHSRQLPQKISRNELIDKFLTSSFEDADNRENENDGAVGAL